MPKSAPRRKRIRTARAEADPTNLPGSKTVAESSSSSGAKQGKSQVKKASTAGQDREKHLGPVLDKLSSDSADDRLWATAATSHILSNADAGTRRALQSKNIVGTLINLLSDETHEIKAEACGALRNLAIEGGAEVCAEMFNKSIVTKLQPQLSIVSQALNNFLNNVKPKNEDEIRVRKVLWAWIEHLSTVFWCLAETSDKAFKAIVTIQPLSDLLYQILKQAVPVKGSSFSSSKIPANVALAAAQAVYVLTDVNVPSAPQFPLPRDVSKSAAYSNTRSMLLESLRKLSTLFESPSASTTSEAVNEQYQSLLVMLIGIYQNLTSQRAFGKSTAKNNEEEQEQEFNRLTLRIVASLISSLDIEKDAQSAIQAFSSLPSSSSTATSSNSGKNASIESVQVSPSRKVLDRMENKWTRIRLALEVLGELVAGVDGLLDPALLGEEEYEEWTGIQQQHDSEMDIEDAEADHDHKPSTGSTTTLNGEKHQQEEQEPLLISKDIRSLLSKLPTILLSLGKKSSISFTSPPPPSTSKASDKSAPNAADSDLISTQIDMPGAIQESSASGDQEPQNGAYVPALSEVFSFVHVRALECLNNLLITLARSGVSEDAEAGARKESEEGEDGDIEAVADEDEDAELPQDMEDMLGDDSAVVDNTPHADDEDDMAAEAARPAEDGKSTSNYLLDNRASFQSTFEGLFHTLVDYQARYRSAINGQLKKKESSFEGLQLIVEACAGCIWALARLCGDQLTVGQDEHRLLLNTLDTSLQEPKSFDIAIRCVGSLGQLAVRQSVSIEENEAIGKALLAQLDERKLSQLNSKDSIGEIDLCSQVLDTVFDVYGEETRSYDPVFQRLGFLAALSAVLPPFKRLTKSVDKRKYPETREAAEAALLNLPAFITYRKQVQKKA